MENIATLLSGKTINEIVSFDDYISIVFNGGESLSIYNDCKVANKSGDACFPCQIQKITHDDSSVEIIADGGLKIVIEMKNENFHGPEAMSYRGQGNRIIVWP